MMAFPTSKNEGEGSGEGRSKPSIVILTLICALKVWFPCYWPRLSLRKVFIHNYTEGDREDKKMPYNQNVSVCAGEVSIKVLNEFVSSCGSLLTGGCQRDNRTLFQVLKKSRSGDEGKDSPQELKIVSFHFRSTPSSHLLLDI